MTPNAVFLIGASCRAAAQSCTRASVETLYAWDEFLDADLVDIAQAAELGSLQVDSLPSELLHRRLLVLCGGMENQPDLVDELVGRGMLCGINGQSLIELRAPDRWQEWALSVGIGWPETLDPSDDHVANRVESIAKDGSWLIKPRRGAGGIYVRTVRSSAEVVREFTEGGTSSNWYFQRHIPGRSIGVTYCSDANATYVVGIAQGVRADELDAPLPFVYSGNIAPCRISPEAQCKAQLFGEVVARTTGIRGLWQADFQVDEQEHLWLLEINPRWSASMELHEITQGFSWMHQHLRILDGFDADLSQHRLCTQRDPEFDRAGPAVGKGIVYAPKTMEVAPAAIERLWQARWHGGVEELQIHPFRVADIPQFQGARAPDPSVLFHQGTPIATVLCSGTSSDELINRLRQAKQIVLEWLEKG